MNIEELMIKEHDRIKNMLYEFKDNPSEDLFSKFKWNLEKHFFVEEKAIFIIYGKVLEKEISNIFSLMQEHGIILENIKGIEQLFKEDINPNVSELKELLIKHTNFEDEVFYRKLNELLNEEQKKFLKE